MAAPLLVEGAWPGRVVITRGWARADARPWNEETSAAQLKLVRGSGEFLEEATSLVVEMCGDTVYSPAIYPSTARIWRRSGYRPVHTLDVMERPMSVPWQEPSLPVELGEPDWDSMVEVDRQAFEGFWRMSRSGLIEASEATGRRAVLTSSDGGAANGYAIVGSQWGVGYLQRVAVSAKSQGRGVGTSLIRAGLTWARSERARSMVLNVRAESARARRMYLREGFMDSGSRLEILACP